MALFAESRCAVALGWSLAPDGSDAAYARALAELAVAEGFRMQFFASGEALAEPCAWLAALATDGHAVDQLSSPAVALNDGDQAAMREELGRTASALEQCAGQRPAGLRVPGGYAAGLHDLPVAQRSILDQGLTFVSSLYATKSPTSKYDIFADKNAYMIMKHHQPRRYESGLLEIPMSGYSDRHFLDELQRPLDQWIQHLRSCLDFAYDMGGLLYAPALHPEVHARHDPDCEAIAALLEHTRRKHDPVRFRTYREVAEVTP
jgi:hypothetical protein